MKKLFLMSLFLLSLMIFQIVIAQDQPDYPNEFPLPEVNKNQVNEAHNCDLLAVALVSSYDPTACQLAQQALSLAGARASKSKPGEAELELVNRIAALNPALLLRNDMLFRYFGTIHLVAPPQLANPTITKFSLSYSFMTLGGFTDYAITITNADTEPIVSGRLSPQSTSKPKQLPQTVAVDRIQAFASALDDLIPIGQQFKISLCCDAYPDWTIELTFADETKLTLVTDKSNLLAIGGPWQTEIDGKFYMQYSTAILVSVNDLFRALDLGYGQPTATFDGGIRDEILDKAYPSPSK